MIGRSKELEDVGRVASSFPTYLGKIEATLLAGYGHNGRSPLLDRGTGTIDMRQLSF